MRNIRTSTRGGPIKRSLRSPPGSVHVQASHEFYQKEWVGIASRISDILIGTRQEKCAHLPECDGGSTPMIEFGLHIFLYHFLQAVHLPTLTNRN